jgi:hypothetical protein
MQSAYKDSITIYINTYIKYMQNLSFTKDMQLCSVTEGYIRSNYVKLNLFIDFQVHSLVVTVDTRFIPMNVHCIYY